MPRKAAKPLEFYTTNVVLCRLVEKHPCIYDKDSPEYANKLYVDSKWSEIAQELNKSVTYCKNHWKEILYSYRHYLIKLARYERENKKIESPYYLAKEVSFMKKHIKIYTHEQDINETFVDHPDTNETSDIGRRLKWIHFYKVNVKLCRLVEKYPCLYDKASPDYANKLHVENAWSEIALELKLSVTYCKTLWKEILCAYTLYLFELAKYDPVNIKITPHYLAEEVSFMKEHIQTDIKDKKIIESAIIEANQDIREEFGKMKWIEFYKDNVKLCRLVERYPCIYDKSSPNHTNKLFVDSAWSEIALEMDKTVTDCKCRWERILHPYRVYYLKLASNSPYYLDEEVAFMKKHLQIDEDINKKNKPEQFRYEIALNLIEENQDASKNDTNQIPVLEISSDSESENDNIQPNSHNEKTHKNDQLPEEKISIKTELDQEKGETSSQIKIEYQSDEDISLDEILKEIEFGDGGVQLISNPKKRKRYDETTENVAETDSESEQDNRNQAKECAVLEKLRKIDTDFEFLTNLLPDMKSMNSRQKIVFKKRIYQTLEEVLSDCKDFPPNTTKTFTMSQPTTNRNRSIATVNPQNMNVTPSIIQEVKTEYDE